MLNPLVALSPAVGGSGCQEDRHCEVAPGPGAEGQFTPRGGGSSGQPGSPDAWELGSWSLLSLKLMVWAEDLCDLLGGLTWSPFLSPGMRPRALSWSGPWRERVDGGGGCWHRGQGVRCRVLQMRGRPAFSTPGKSQTPAGARRGPALSGPVPPTSLPPALPSLTWFQPHQTWFFSVPGKEQGPPTPRRPSLCLQSSSSHHLPDPCLLSLSPLLQCHPSSAWFFSVPPATICHSIYT